MRVVFRVDASLEMGIGHVMRCLSLALELKNHGANVEFICRKHKGNLIHNIRSNGFSVFELELPRVKQSDNSLSHGDWLGATQYQDASECMKKLKTSKVDWLIVDHYAIDQHWQQSLKAYYCKLLVIDDLSDRRHDCDIFLDQNFGRKEQDYKRLLPKSCEILLGSKYALLREEFAKWRKYSLERRKNPAMKKILVSMGGVDAENITGQVLEELSLCKLPEDIFVTIVMGGTAPHLENIRQMVNNLPYKAELKVNIDNMAEIMANVDLAIGATGSTTWERCCLGLPTIQIVIAKNQNIIAELLVRKNAIKLIKEVEELSSILISVNSWMKDISDIARDISDGLGSKRVANILMQKRI